VVRNTQPCAGGELALQQTQPRACLIAGGGETCALCGLAAYPAHRPQFTDEVFCSSCCPQCKARQPALDAEGTLWQG
jgi:hypothetical protein